MIASHLYKLVSEGLLNFELLICKDEQETSEAFELLKFTKGVQPFMLPEFRAMFGDDLRSFNQEFSLLCDQLRAFYQCNQKKLLIAPLSSVLHALPASKHLQSFKLSKHSTNINSFSFHKQS